MHDTIVIGAGMAGLTCATQLAAQGRNVLCLDKGRGPGGRMASRRVEEGGQTLRFDHGAQYMTVREPEFARAVAQWESDGLVARWPAAGEDAWVGTPSMNAPVRAMAEAVEVRWNERVAGLACDAAGWRVDTADAAHRAAEIVIAIPPEQAAPLLRPHQPAFAARAAETRSQPCWAVMARFAQTLPLGEVVRSDGTIAWAARDSAKPGRAAGERWVLHASHPWSEEHLEAEPDEVIARLLEAFFENTGLETPELETPGLETTGQTAKPDWAAAHRWRYALPRPLAGHPALWDAERRLGVAGDWLIAPRVESAWMSGARLAGLILGETARANARDVAAE